MIQLFGKKAIDLPTQFLDSWDPSARPHVRTYLYDGFPFWGPFPGSVCIFTSLEALQPYEMSMAIKLSDALRARPSDYTVLNEPRRYPGRLNLLKILHVRGMNDYQAQRLDEISGDLKFPVFVRNEKDHAGPLTPLLHSRDELKRALAAPALQDRSVRKDLIVVEYCDCSQEGLFRKYSAMNVAGTLVPRHILFSDNWCTKKPDLVDEKKAAEEADFVKTFPHADQVRKVFKLAGLDYGRIDYGVRNGRIQVWEINSNPVIVPPREEIKPLRMPAQSESARRIIEAMVTLSNRHKNNGAYPFRTFSFLIGGTTLRARRLKTRIFKNLSPRRATA